MEVHASNPKPEMNPIALEWQHLRQDELSDRMFNCEDTLGLPIIFTLDMAAMVLMLPILSFLMPSYLIAVNVSFRHKLSVKFWSILGLHFNKVNRFILYIWGKNIIKPKSFFFDFHRAKCITLGGFLGAYPADQTARYERS